jgi:Phytoene dehydrogenase and related proteins
MELFRQRKDPGFQSLNHTMPLKVVVVGAGLAGLGAAIALNRSGHEVQVGLEDSDSEISL